MRIGTIVSVGVLLVVLMSGSARAQDRPIHVNFGGGPTFLFGTLGDKFSTGWGPAVGITFDMNPRMAFQFEYAYRWFNVDETIDAQAGRLSANHKTHQLDFNLVAKLTGADTRIRVFMVAGPGMYNRNVEITRYEGTGVICDPYYYVCGSYPIESILGSRGGWDFGFNVGGGVGLPLGDDAEFYVETRYHYIWGPEIAQNGTLPAEVAPTNTKVNGQYWPLTFGFRF